MGEGAIRRLEREARADGMEPPDFDRLRAKWIEAGWPGDPPVLHLQLLQYAAAVELLGEAFVEGPSGPRIDWPAGWGSWSLVAHRRAVAMHRRRVRGTLSEERALLALALGRFNG